MSAAASLAFPGSRTLGAWWRQLTSHHPEEMWVGYYTFHHLAAPFLVLRPQKLPALESFVLRAVALCRPSASLTALADWLHLDTALILQILVHLQGEGLVTLPDDGLADLTDAGQHAVAHGDYPRPRRERRTLHFWHADWTSPPSSHFVQLLHPDTLAWLAAPQTPFAVEQLEFCVGQSEEWKRHHAFPADIRALLAKPTGVAVEAWDQVVVASPQRLFAVVVRMVVAGHSMLVGFAVNGRNWEMHAAHPAFQVPDEPGGRFGPAVAESASRQAFVDWCQQRQIPVQETEQCGLTLEGCRLRVAAAPALLERLHTGRGEYWVLAGDGAVRTALRLDFT